MKLKGTWISLWLILAVGILSTDYVKRQTGDRIVTEAKMETGAAKEAVEADSEIQMSKPQGNFALSTVEKTVNDTAPAESGYGMPGKDADSLTQFNLAEDKKESNSALIRLEELDEQIAKNRAKETEMTANSRKASAESERKLWEGEVQHMLDTLKEQLDSDQQDELMLQQKAWMKDRESQAIAISGKQAGGSMEELSYSMAFTELTRMRAYELAEAYSAFLQE